MLMSMSQCGQSLTVEGGVAVHMEKINAVSSPEDNSIWVEANSTWAALLESSIKQSKVPYVVPYNCNLSIAGVLSAGGVGAASFKFGSVVAHVEALEVITANGELHSVDSQSPLFRACLGGQGRFGVITRACIQLRPAAKKVRTFFLVYLDKEQWLEDIVKARKFADHIESFCTPSIQGAKLTSDGRRSPFAEWLFALHVAVEYDEDKPQLDTHLNPWKVLHCQDEAIKSWLHRHDSRFSAMKLTGQWELQHPWYECFVPAKVLINSLDELLISLPIHYATVLQIVPMANLKPAGFFMLPDAPEIFAVMILNPGLPSPLIPSCLDTIKALDVRFLNQGGKRYLSGFLGDNLNHEYWKNHFNSHYEDWVNLKQHYDHKQIFRSLLHNWTYD
jgi:FAD/FMN-containing dehydrogenase